MSGGRLIAVVGPSGVGKDSVMAGISAACPQVQLVRRTITRAPGLGGEDYDAVDVETFQQRAAGGAFCVYWGAHGLYYGIPASAVTDCADGRILLANFSRSALAQGAAVFENFRVLNITASPQTLAQRLRGRGRESADEIAMRFAQADKPLPAGLDVVHVANDGALEDAVQVAVAKLGLSNGGPQTHVKPQELRHQT